MTGSPMAVASPAAKPAASPAASPAAAVNLAGLPEAFPKPSGKRLSLLTGGTAGTYYPFGGAMATLWTQGGIGVEVTVEATGASVENIRLLNDKQADLALVQNDIADYAKNGTEMFQQKATVSGIAILYPELIQLVATTDSGINSVRDLRGKRVGMGAPGSGNEANARQILSALGLTSQDLGQAAMQSYAEMAGAMKDRRLDAMFVTAGVPNSAIQDIASSQSIKLVPITGADADAVKAKYTFFADAAIPGGVYQGVTGETRTIAVQSTLVARPDLEDNVVYWLTRTLFEKQPQLAQAHAKGADLSLRTALAGMSIDLHPGAQRFYDQAGVKR